MAYQSISIDKDLNVGDEINFDAWIFQKSKVYLLQEVVHEQKREKMLFVFRERNNKIMILKSDVSLIFEKESEENKTILIGFECSIFNETI